MVKSRVSEELDKFVQDEAVKDGYQLVDIVPRGGNTTFFEIVLDKEGGITLDECSKFNNKISTWIEENDMFKGNFILDVCSPGLDRMLKSDGDFEWAKGKQVKINLYNPIDERKELSGELLEVNSDKDVTISKDDEGSVKIERKNISKAKLLVKLAAIERLEREKGISKDILFEAIESALVSAARKIIGGHDIAKEEISVVMDKETGEMNVYVDDEEVDSEQFGRIAAQTAKQVIIQKIREAERDVIYDKYSEKVGSIISGHVHRFEKGNVIVELTGAEAMLPKSELIPREKFRQGESIRAYLLKVEKGLGGPEIILSRSDEGFVKRLFELEVPEISQGIVEIKGIARETGERTKIAVCSKDEKVDPVGACVGMRGTRVKDIVKELHGERIDIVRWSSDTREYLKAALSPAEIYRMDIDRDNNRIDITVEQDQLSLAIGKKGRNIRLASKLIDWELNVEAIDEVIVIPVTELQGVGDKIIATLDEAGYDTVDKVKKAGKEGLVELSGIGDKKADKILEACEAIIVVAKEQMSAEGGGSNMVFEEVEEEVAEEEQEETPEETAEEETEETEEEVSEEEPQEEEVAEEEQEETSEEVKTEETAEEEPEETEEVSEEEPQEEDNTETKE